MRAERERVHQTFSFLTKAFYKTKVAKLYLSYLIYRITVTVVIFHKSPCSRHLYFFLQVDETQNTEIVGMSFMVTGHKIDNKVLSQKSQTMCEGQTAVWTVQHCSSGTAVLVHIKLSTMLLS